MQESQTGYIWAAFPVILGRESDLDVKLSFTLSVSLFQHHYKDSKLPRKYSLQATISTLFITISIIFAAILSWQSFNKTSEIMLESAHDLYERISQQLMLDFKVSYGPLEVGLRQFRLLPLSKAENYTQRSVYLPGFKAMFESAQSLSSVGIAYANGDYFGFFRVGTGFVPSQYSVPDDAAFIASYVKGSEDEADFSVSHIYYIFYDEALNELDRTAGEPTQFDPRLRSWYRQAKPVPGTTKPYLFYESKTVGLSVMSQTTEPGVVVVLDVMLGKLSETIAKYQLTPDSEVVLINAEGRTFAYRDLDKFILRKSYGVSGSRSGDDEFQLAHLNGLDSGVLNYLSQRLEAKEQDLDFDYGDRRWIGSMRVISRADGVELFALMVSPVAELLADAVVIRWRLVVIAFFILLLFIPLIWYTSRKISAPLHTLAQEADAISRFDFSATQSSKSFIAEVDELDTAMAMMRSTINKFISLIDSLASEKDLDALLKSITEETMRISQSDAALIYLIDEKDDYLKAEFMCDRKNNDMNVTALPAIPPADTASLFDAENRCSSHVLSISADNDNALSPLLSLLDVDCMNCILLPLQNRNNQIIGLLVLIDLQAQALTDRYRTEKDANIEFVQALSGFAAVTLESRQLFAMQEDLLHAFIKLIAGAIDAKSPYTSGHCQRVPEITFMLARAACESSSDKYGDFDLDEDQWKELKVACWLHDCGKVTTPEYVVDKATKLETIYDRIHEVRTRFEVLKRDAEIECWQQIAATENINTAEKQALLDELRHKCEQLDDDFAFIAECNVGGEFMADEKITRLKAIAEKTWLRTIDDSLGLSWEELNRKTSRTQTLPVVEQLLADKEEHRISRHETDCMPADNPWGFKVDTPEYKYDRGELYNLSVKRGTLNDEERYMINAHMIQTIIMLNNLPYPKNLSNVPLIAGSHHETMDGKGYPKRLIMAEQPLTARMMVIADIFEALTASDRPYKKAKTLSESIRILSFMRDDRHIDADLFELFLRSGVYLEYGRKFLQPAQIDEVDIDDYLS